MKQKIIKTTFTIGLILAGTITAFTTPYSSPMINQRAPEIHADTWLNTSPLSMKSLRGKVVLVEFWTFGCYNCVNVQPYIKQWHAKYSKSDLVIIAVHSPEFDHEKKLSNVRNYVSRNQIHYPIVTDNDFKIWRSYSNRYWPAVYLIDKKGTIRYFHAGEGRYNETERMIKRLLSE